MLRSQALLLDTQRAPGERLGSLIFALRTVECCQIVEADGRARMLGAKHLFPDGQGALVERFGLLVLALAVVECWPGRGGW